MKKENTWSQKVLSDHYRSNGQTDLADKIAACRTDAELTSVLEPSPEDGTLADWQKVLIMSIPGAKDWKG